MVNQLSSNERMKIILHKAGHFVSIQLVSCWRKLNLDVHDLQSYIDGMTTTGRRGSTWGV